MKRPHNIAPVQGGGLLRSCVCAQLTEEALLGRGPMRDLLQTFEALKVLTDPWAGAHAAPDRTGVPGGAVTTGPEFRKRVCSPWVPP